MSLTTRCSACGTLFRVVQDQLRVSEGWVRCGRCDTVFNALDALVELDTAAAAASDAGDPGAPHDPFHEPPGSAAQEAADGPHAPPPPYAATEDLLSAPVERAELHRWGPPGEAESEHEADRMMPTSFGRATTGPSESPLGASHVHASLLRPEPSAVAGDTEPVPPRSDSATGLPAMPEFVRRAERDARWTSPAMRAALVGSALILLAVLGLQAAYHFRDAVAARSAVADGLLRSACLRWGCRIEAPRRIQDVSLEGSGLSRIAQAPQAVKLSINLRNRGNTDLAMPSVDLSLTDAQGQLIARRVLGPADFRIAPPLIRRGAELPLELVLSTGERGISGYTVELFYP